MPRRLWIDWLVCTVVLMLAYAGRGWLLAWLLQGRYPWLSLIIDVCALAFLICTFRLLDLGLRVWFQRLLERRPDGTPKLWRWLLDVARFAIVFAVAAPFLVTLSQLHPQRIACAVTPSDRGIPYEDVSLTCDGLKLAAWYIPGAQGPDQPVVLIVHGVGANKQNLLPVAERLHEWGYPVLMLDFRAHGDSEGLLSTLGMREADDVKAALDWIGERHPRQPIYGLGYSMGAVALVRASADNNRCAAYILDSTYARLENSARHTMATYYIPGPLIAPWWGATRFWGFAFIGLDLEASQPEQEIGGLADRPLLLVHGTSDGTTSFQDTLRLQELTEGNAEVWLIEGAGHLQSIGHAEYYPRIKRFLESVRRNRSSV